jgi:hypothetical protein
MPILSAQIGITNTYSGIRLLPADPRLLRQSGNGAPAAVRPTGSQALTEQPPTGSRRHLPHSPCRQTPVRIAPGLGRCMWRRVPMYSSPAIVTRAGTSTAMAGWFATRSCTAARVRSWTSSFQVRPLDFRHASSGARFIPRLDNAGIAYGHSLLHDRHGTRTKHPPFQSPAVVGHMRVSATG